MSTLLIENGRLVDPSQNLDASRDLLFEDGLVRAVESPGAFARLHAERIDASGLVVAPGLVDIHVHLREPGQSYKETIATGTAAAAAGGFTAVAAMPNTQPVNDSPEITRWMQSPDRHARIRVFPIAAATQGSLGEALTDYPALKDAGAVAVSDDGRPILGDEIMRRALAAAAQAGLPLIQHAEDTRLTPAASMNAGPLAFRLGLRGMPVEAEAAIVARDIRLLEQLNDSRAHLHVAHISTAAALNHVRSAKQRGLRVTCEVTPHHFALTEDRIGDYDTDARMNPPLRSESDRTAVLQALLDRTIDCIATDHAPHALHEKEQEFERAPNGITGLETALGLALLHLHREHGLPLSRVIALLSTQPAQLLSLAGHGSLAPGRRADAVLFQPETQWRFDAARSRSKSRNTPFHGAPMLGRIHAAIAQGRLVFADSDRNPS